MSTTLIVVSSQTGFTARYADWLAEETGADVTELKQTSQKQLAQYDLLVCGSAICGGEFRGLKQFRHLCAHFPKERILIFATGIRPATERTVRMIRENNFPEKAADTVFYYEGGMNREKLDTSQKTLLLCYKAMMQRRRSLSPEDETVLKRMQVSGDYTNREAIRPLAKRICELQNDAKKRTAGAAFENVSRMN